MELANTLYRHLTCEIRRGEIKMGELTKPLEPGGWLRYSREVSLKSTGSRLLLSKPQSPKSSHITRPSASPQLTPSHRQQSLPAFHDRKAAVESSVMVKDRFNWSNADAWSGKHGTAGGRAPVWLVYVADDEEGMRRGLSASPETVF
uniref:Uncharacterized protein n=1 Tax=Oryza rufipogon TaxID=4529 RepID=A0A0E0MRN8_ORYRU